jgi:sphinganine-1-phosphate aldolase
MMQDPITHLAALARKHKIGMHVDCCLGSFLMPFLSRAGLGDGVEKFDFSVPGVTSISCDVVSIAGRFATIADEQHKYAFCPKGRDSRYIRYVHRSLTGVSVIMYHSAELRRHQYYVITDWPGGVYASPSLAGSRPGALLAGSWAVMNHIGAK